MGENTQTSGSIRVLLADDHTMFRQGLAGVLASRLPSGIRSVLNNPRYNKGAASMVEHFLEKPDSEDGSSTCAGRCVVLRGSIPSVGRFTPTRFTAQSPRNSLTGRRDRARRRAEGAAARSIRWGRELQHRPPAAWAEVFRCSA